MASWQSEELYLSNISPDVTEAELKTAFASYGTVKEVVFVSKRSGGKASQAAVVRMSSHPEALSAKKVMGGSQLKNRTLNVKWSSSARVLWVGDLHDTVTNEVLEAAFTQFGNVQRAIVVADATQNTVVSKRYGFVVYENKRDATKAYERCHQAPLLVGPTQKPIRIAYAHAQDFDMGYSEAAKSGLGRPPPTAEKISPAAAARFAAPGSREFATAARMAELYQEFETLRDGLKMRLQEAETRLLVMGSTPNLAAMVPMAQPGAPPPQQPMGAPPPGAMMQAPPPGAPPPLRPTFSGAPPPDLYFQQQQQLKRPGEDFHHVAPPKRTTGDYERFNPLPGKPAPPSVPPPMVPPGAPPPRSSAFIRGGELHTVSEQEQAAAKAATVAAVKVEKAPSGDVGKDVPAALAGVPVPSGVKPPGAHDHKGIGFSSNEGAPAAPASNIYVLHAPASQGGPTHQQHHHPDGSVTFSYTQPPPQQQQQPPQQQQLGGMPLMAPATSVYSWQPAPAAAPQLQAPPVQQPPPQQIQYYQQQPAPTVTPPPQQQQPAALGYYAPPGAQQPPPQQPPQQQQYQPQLQQPPTQYAQQAPQQGLTPQQQLLQQQFLQSQQALQQALQQQQPGMQIYGR